MIDVQSSTVCAAELVLVRFLEPVPETSADFAELGKVSQRLGAVAAVEVVTDALEIKREAVK